MLRSLLFTLCILVQGISAFAQSVVTGYIHDKTGSPIVGATVVLSGTNKFATTDANGNFTIDVATKIPFTLTISSVGFKSQEIEVFELTEELFDVTLIEDILMDEVVVTARRRTESAQEIPISLSVIGSNLIEDGGAYNVNKIKEMVPTVQLYSSNPRNTTLNIRGLGSTFGLTNDGIDPGVGFYVDGVYYARPAATTFDFIDIEQIEVLRGPQGTLFGKNTTAGAFNITTRKASFTPDASFELSYGNYGFIQAKTSVNGPITKKLAARISFSGTQRNGILYNTITEQAVNDLNNLGFRGQVLYKPNEKLEVTLSGDAASQRPNGYAQVNAGVVTTLRPAYRQFNAIIADLNYTLPHDDPFDRKIDHDTPWKSGNDLGGASANIEYKTDNGTFTSTTAWRYWNWDPSNDRDFTGLEALALSQAPSEHNQWSQEFRYAGDFSQKISGVIGAFALWQNLHSDDVHTEESGKDQWRFVQKSTSDLWATPGLFDGYGIHTKNLLESFSGAIFGQIDWAATKKLHVLPGMRYNFDKKYVEYDRKTYGGLVTNDPALIALKESVYNDQEFTTDAHESNFSGQLTVSYAVSPMINSFATYSISYKPIGVNLGGLPREGTRTMIELATIKPEKVHHLEVGIKTSPTDRSTVNLIFHNTQITDFQTLVQAPDLSVNRGYLANADKVRVLGAELDGNIRLGQHLTVNASLAYTDGIYVTFTNAPPPLEETGGPTYIDISGSELPGISKWAGSLGGELSSNIRKFFGLNAKVFLGIDAFSRSSFSSSPSKSAYLNIDGYGMINSRFGFRANEGLTMFIWGRNILDSEYYEMLLPGAGNVGNYAAVLCDPATFGITLRYNWTKPDSTD